MNEYLASVYYDPTHTGSFGGASKLYKAVRREGRNDITLDDVKTWLRSQDTYTLHRSVSGIQCQFDVDLSDVSSMSRHNDGIKFLLITIDVFSRFLWVVPLKSKTGKEVMHACEIILKHKTPKCIRSDKGTEFTNRLVQNYFKDHGVHHFVTDNEPKAN